MSHYNRLWTSAGWAPCGKDLKRCNWTTAEWDVTCKGCREFIANTPDTHPKDGDAKQGSTREWPDKVQKEPSNDID